MRMRRTTKSHVERPVEYGCAMRGGRTSFSAAMRSVVETQKLPLEPPTNLEPSYMEDCTISGV
jgi:hypothetical protein